MVCRRCIENRDFPSAPYWRLSVAEEREGISPKAVSSSVLEGGAGTQSVLAIPREQNQLTVTSVAKKVGHTSLPLLYDLTAL